MSSNSIIDDQYEHHILFKIKYYNRDITSYMFSILTVLYFLITYLIQLKHMTDQDVLLYFIFALILALIPLGRPFNSNYPSFYIYFYGSIIIILVLAQEEIIRKYGNPSISVYLGMVIIYRSISYNTLIDNFAIATAYFADSSILYYDTQRQLLGALLFICGIFMFTLSATNILKRLRNRSKEHIAVLIILLERHKREIEQTKSMFKTSIPSELLNENFDDDIKTPIDLDLILDEESLKNEAIQRRLIPRYKEAKINIGDLTSTMTMKKKLTVIVGFRHIGEDSDCYVSSLRLNKIHHLLDLIGSMHKISCVHRFGDKWLGCIGFFEDTWGSAANDCYHAILAAIQILQLAEKSQGKLAAAIDCGYVVGGFVGQPSFDLFGSEVRWVLDTIDCNRVGEILVSNTVKSKVSRDINIGQNEKEIQFTRTSLAGKDSGDKVFIVATELNCLNNEDFRKVKSEIEKCYLNNNYQAVIETMETVKPPIDSYNSVFNRLLFNISSLLNSWESSLGIEFKSDTFERFGISMDDPILKEYGKKVVRKLIGRIESELEDLVANTFVSKWSYILLTVPFFLQNKVSDKAQFKVHRNYSEAVNPVNIFRESWIGRIFSYFSTHQWSDSNKYAETLIDDSDEYTELFDNASGQNRKIKNKTAEDSEEHIINIWKQYNSDVRLTSHRSISYHLINFILVTCSLFVALNNFHIGKNQLGIVVFVGIHALAVIALAMFERNYDNFVFIAVSCCSVVLTVLMPYCFFDKNNSSQSGLLAVFFVLYPIEIRVEVKYVLINNFMLILILIICSSSSKDTIFDASIICSYVLLFLVRFIYIWVLQYRSYTAFILEHILMPEALKTSNKQREYKIRAYRECYPHISDNFIVENSSSRARRHRNVAVIAIHIKASDILPAILHQHQLGIFLRNVINIINTCISESGLIKLSQFCGLTIAAACDDFQMKNQHAQAPISYVTKCFVFLKNLQKRLDDFDQNYNFNVAVGVGLSHGPMTTGTFFGHYGNSFVLSEDVRIQSHQMAFCRQKGIYASMAFESEITKGRMFEDINIRKVKATVNERPQEWLSIGRAYSGMGIDDFEPKHVLGKGGYGTVILCVDKETGVQYAVKVITRKLTTTQDHNLIQRELFILQKIKHANVVNFKFCLIKEPKIYLVMTLINGGNLKQILDRDPSIGIEQLKFWFAELVLAIEYIHSMRIIHRDVKPSNCMIDEEGHLQLADFGLSKIISESIPEKIEVNNNSSDLNDDSIKMLQKVLFLKPFSNERRMSKEIKFQVLLVESTYNSKLAIDLMESLFDVHVVTTVNEALDLKSKKRRYDFDIIVVNINSTRESEDKKLSNTLQIYKEIRALDNFNHVPVIALALTDDIWIQQICMSIRATECLLLPWQVSYRDLVVKHGRYYRLIKGPSASREPSKSPRFFPINLSLTPSDSVVETPKDKSESNISVNPVSTQVNQRHQNPLQSVKSQGPQQHSAVGTINFMAPEVVAERKYGKAVDWWAVGVTFYECATRSRLFNGNDKNVIFELILSQVIDLTPLQYLSPPLTNIVRRLLERDPLTRMGTDGSAEIKSSDFFKDINWNTISISDLPYKPESFEVDENEKNIKYARQVYYGADQPFFKQFNQLNNSNRMSSRERRRDNYARRKGSIGSHVKNWISGEHTSDRKKLKEWSGTSGIINSRRNDSANYTIEEKESEGSSTSMSSTLLHSGED